MPLLLLPLSLPLCTAIAVTLVVILIVTQERLSLFYHRVPASVSHRQPEKLLRASRIFVWRLKSRCSRFEKRVCLEIEIFSREKVAEGGSGKTMIEFNV